jgi:BirA family biotin operon repressor/biotin-[acetyl-CoA-carboxylase] ligase
MIEHLKERLKTQLIGKNLFVYKDIPSTNDIAKELVVMGVETGTVVISEKQSHGRGRLGRRWLSPEGGLWFSIILKPRIKPNEVFKLTFLTAVVVVRTLRKKCNLNAQIKWPNDVLINGKKICGILSELFTNPSDLSSYVIVGIGINANIDLNTFPKHLQFAVTSICSELNKEIDREAFLSALLLEFENYYRLLTDGEFAFILEEWKKVNCILDAYVEVANLDRTIKGQAVGIAKDGALLIKLENGSVQRVVAGDVKLKKFDKPQIKAMSEKKSSK